MPSDFWLQVIPKHKRKELIFKAHDLPTSGHCGIQRTYDRLLQCFYWPKMKSDVASYVRNCITCQATKPERKKTAGLTAPRRVVDTPWSCLSIDLVGPLPRSNRGFTYILTIVDQFSKFPLLFPLRSGTAGQICHLLEDHVFLLFGVPKNVISDNGVQFKSREFRNLCDSYGVEIKYTALYHPQANPAERVNQVIKSMLRAYVSENHRIWDLHLAKIACAIRTQTQEVTKMTPYFINFGREMVINGRAHNRYGDGESFDPRVRSKALEEVRADVKKKWEKATESSKRVYDLRRRDQSYLVNDLVWRKNYVLSDAAKYFNAKLAPKYIGPFSVAKVLSPWTYELQDSCGKSAGNWHAKDLKAYYLAKGRDC